jgi:hypothetical protein
MPRALEIILHPAMAGTMHHGCLRANRNYWLLRNNLVLSRPYGRRPANHALAVWPDRPSARPSTLRLLSQIRQRLFRRMFQHDVMLDAQDEHTSRHHQSSEHQQSI